MQDFQLFFRWFYLSLRISSFKMVLTNEPAYFDYAPGYYEAALKYKSYSLDLSFVEEDDFFESTQVKNGASNFPFKYNHELEDLVRELAKDVISEGHLFKKLYDWVSQNVPYDHEKYNQIEQYEKDKTKQRPVIKDSLETFIQKKGICCEQAYLLVTMGRLAKLDTYFVDVEEDGFGKKVAHACSALKTKNKEYILADPAYEKFNIRHKNFSIWTADTTVKEFRHINDTIYTIKDLVEECDYSPIFVESIKSDKEVKMPKEKINHKPILKEIIMSALLAAGFILYITGIEKYYQIAESAEKIHQQRIEYVNRR